MNMKKEMSIAVIFLAAAIIFVSSTPMANNAFAQTEGEEALLQTELEDNSDKQKERLFRKQKLRKFPKLFCPMLAGKAEFLPAMR